MASGPVATLSERLAEVGVRRAVGIVVVLGTMAVAAAVADNHRQLRAQGMAFEIIANRRNRVRLVGSGGLDASLRHELSEMGAEAGREQDVDAVDRVSATPARRMEGLFGAEVEPGGLNRLGAWMGIVDQEAARAACVAGYGPEVLTGDGDLHGDASLTVCTA